MMRTVAVVLTLCCLRAALSSAAVSFAAEPDSQAADSQAPSFERDIAPLLTKRCLACHHAGEASGELRLDRLEAVLAGGESGAAIEPGDAESSLLLERVTAGDMPPEERGQSQELPEAEIELLRRWIESGAAWPEDMTLDPFEYTNDVRGGRDWWSLRPITRPAVPQVNTAAAAAVVANPIDAFILARQQAAGVRPAPPAQPRVLVRRLYYDLLGMPPTAEQIEAFAADPSDAAWARLVDELLASPHYGERWARRWLDIVRFAETSGYERDQEKPFAWRYRDWVVAALNNDMPYDQFVLYQVAGDEVPGRDIDTVTGTGFLRLGTWNDEPNDPQDYKYERLEDLVHATSTAFLALTVKCARCHDHKFDPIPQDDYYRMAAAFWAGPIEPRGSDLLGGPSSEELGFDEVLGWTDIRGDPPPLHLLKDGDRQKPDRVVAAEPMSFVPVLASLVGDVNDVPPKDSASTGRRLRLARWLADERNPLVTRVWVNRLWQGHFGEGIVRSPDNFGFTGDPPTHPQLLDWLASELLAHGRQAKHIHRLILTSRTWQQSSLHPDRDAIVASDAGNRLWWHAVRRRLDAEALRDSLLAVSGDLDLRVGGPSFKPTIASEALEGLSRKDAAWQPSPAAEQRRRSLYTYTKRGLLPPMMTAFDLTDSTSPCGRRDVTTVAPQALAMLNNAFTHERSRALADRVLTMSSGGGTESTRDNDNVQTVWRLALGRAPREEERQLAEAHLAAQRERYVVRQQTEIAAVNEQPAAVDEAATGELSIRDALVLHLRADNGVTLDAAGQVATWQDMSPAKHDASQADSTQRPELVADAFANQPALRFGGDGQFLRLAGQVLASTECTVIAVVTDYEGRSHREIISNWNGDAGNAGSSLFLGLTGDATVRFSDAMAQAGEIAEGHEPFVLTAVNAANEAAVYQNGGVLSRQSSGLPARRLDTPWVIGQQGNINGEFWHGDIAEVIVFDRALDGDELHDVWSYLHARYDLELVETTSTAPPTVSDDPDYLALVSLCHVLLNSNEFLYID